MKMTEVTIVIRALLIVPKILVKRQEKLEIGGLSLNDSNCSIVKIVHKTEKIP